MINNQETDKEIENVRVAVRIRPLNKEEKENHKDIITVFEEDNVITLKKLQSEKNYEKLFKFDYLLSENCSQTRIYQKLGHPIIEEIFKGYNGCILAYGQTGSGKTYTMFGIENDDNLKGIIPNTFSHIFSQISRASNEKSFVVTVTYLEIYNEEIRDLLSTNPNHKLELRERADIGVYVKDLTGYTVDTIETINELMKFGNVNRKTRATLMNNLSSRSHAVFTIIIETKNKKDNQTVNGKLNLVDLAGSERLNRTQVTGEGLKEASNINQSLFVLSNVISALVEEKSTYIPYRNSKLTRLLQDSLGGNSKTVMIAAISPWSKDYDETLCTLRYVSRAKLITNFVKPNIQQANNGLIENFEKQILELQNHFNMINLKEEEVKILKLKRCKSYVTEENLLHIENIKNNLSNKIAAIQNKILVGGQNLLDKAQEQEYLLESSFEEIRNLDKSHQELEEILGDREIERFDLTEQYSSLQEEDKVLDKKIEKLEKLINSEIKESEELQQEHQHELKLILETTISLKNELELVNSITNYTIPKSQLKKIQSNIVWNENAYDYQIVGIAHLGNNTRKPKRRFKKHIPKTCLMGVLFNQRKNMTPAIKFNSTSKTCKMYQHYPTKAHLTQDFTSIYLIP